MNREAPIRVGIAGLGRSGWAIHARLLTQLAEKYQVVAVVDGDPRRREEAVDQFDCQGYERFSQLTQDPGVELVVVAMPSHLHADLSIAALQAGKHVVCEKPMATSLADADRMIAAAAQSPGLLTVFQNRRYSPDFVKVREILASGVLGRIVQIRITASGFSRRWDWQTLQRFGGGSLNNTGPHFLDQALQLLGEARPQVTAKLDRTLTLGDADDYVKILLQAENAPLIDIEISSCDAYAADLWHIMGTRGGLRGTARMLQWKYFDPGDLPPRSLDPAPTPDRSYNRDQIPWIDKEWREEEEPGIGFAGFYLDLYGSIRHGTPPPVTPESVRRAIWLQEECHRLSPLPEAPFPG